MTAEGTGEVLPTPDHIVFVGWMDYDPADPQMWALLSVKNEAWQGTVYRPSPQQGRRVVPVRITVPLPSGGTA